MFSLAEILKVSAATGILKRPKWTLQTLSTNGLAARIAAPSAPEFHPTSA